MSLGLNWSYVSSQVPDDNVIALLAGSQWEQGFVTYSFPDARSDYAASDTLADGFAPASIYLQNAARSVLEGNGRDDLPGYMSLTAVEQFTNLNVLFAGYDASGISVARDFRSDRPYANFPATGSGGDVWLPNNFQYAVVGTYTYHSVLHEIGHALGLKHGHEGDVVLSEDRNSIEFSVMTYHSYIGDTREGFEGDGPSTFMMYDIAALQYLYGADFTTNNTDTVYVWDSAKDEVYVNGEKKADAHGYKIFMTIWDGGGVDTYDLSDYSTNMTIDLAPGGWSVFSDYQLADLGDGHKARANVFNALQYQGDPRSLIENVIGGRGNDDISGNAANNELNGNSGNDTLYGAAGNDRLIGGLGADHLRGGKGADFLDGGAGTYDTIEYSDATTSVSVNLGTNVVSGGIATGDQISGFENIIGGGQGDILYGSSGANVILGNSGADQIVGSGGADYLAGENGDDMIIVNEGGSATMVGGSGNDMFVVFPGTHAKILDFVAGSGVADQLFIYKNVFSTFAEAYAASYESGGSTYIVKGEFSIELVGVTLAQLHPNDFNFLNI